LFVHLRFSLFDDSFVDVGTVYVALRLMMHGQKSWQNILL